MAHSTLVPEDGAYLSSRDVVSRLQGEFALVNTDQELGRKEYEKGLEYLRSLLHKGLSPGGRNISDELAIAEAKREEALFISIADSPTPGDAFLSTTLVPGEPLFFGYCSEAHQNSALPLLERVKKALHYCDSD